MADVQPRLVIVLVYDGVALADLAALDVFTAASALAAQAGVRGYAIKLIASRGGLVPTFSGAELRAEPLAALDARSIDTILVPGGAGPDAPHPPELVAWLREHAPDARRIVSVCTGAFVLAKAGLLSERRATTHWAAAEALKARYPEVRVEPDPIFIRDGNIWTSAGVSAGVDLALALVQEDLGHQIAMQTARALVVYLKRPGGQSQYSAPLAAQAAADPEFAELHGWIREHMHEDLDLPTLAERAGLSPRTLERRYVSKLGQTPLKVLETMRLETARLLLEDPDFSLKEIARRTGFGDQQRLRRAFQRRFGVTPSDYRERFVALPSSAGG
jgi:transcriptional regulator GlxA family with amidase domain